ncbi:MAG: hypothetical protein AAFX50_25240, partial [Acidobacteriota bacterium]
MPPVDWGPSFERIVRSSVPFFVEGFFEVRRGELTRAEAGRSGSSLAAGVALGGRGAGEAATDESRSGSPGERDNLEIAPGRTPAWLLEEPTPSWVFASPGIFPFTKERPWTGGHLGPLEIEALIEWGAADGAPGLAAAELAISWLAPQLSDQE